MPFFIDIDDFFLLRLQVENLAQARARQRTLRVQFPRLRGGTVEPRDVVEVGEALKTTLAAVSSASRRLKANSVGIALGSEPLSMSLSGRFLGMLPESGQVFMQITPQGREKNDGAEKG